MWLTRPLPVLAQDLQVGFMQRRDIDLQLRERQVWRYAPRLPRLKNSLLFEKPPHPFGYREMLEQLIAGDLLRFSSRYQAGLQGEIQPRQQLPEVVEVGDRTEGVPRLPDGPRCDLVDLLGSELGILGENLE